MKKWSILFLYFAFSYHIASADTIIPGNISSDTTWSPAGGIYLIDSNFSVAPGITLAIEPGTIIKAKTTALGGPSIYGHIVAHGTADSPIYFTSIYDDSVGGDTGNDGPTSGATKDWQGLYFKSGSVADLDHIVLHYAGYGGFGFGDLVGIENEGGVLTIKNSLIDQNNQYGIWQKSGTLILENTTISNQIFGLAMWGDTVTATGNSFSSNSQYGIYASDGDSLSLTGNDFTNNAKTAYVAAPIDFSHTGNTSSDISNRGFETSGEARDGAVWQTSDLPLILIGVSVGSGKTLTLSNDAVLKMPSGGYLNVEGSLVSNGTESAPIYFTSIKDDSVSGDTNGDGDASLPNVADWIGITFYSGSVGNISHSIVEYSGGLNGFGRSGIFNLGGTLSLDTVSFFKNYLSDIYQNAGSLSVTKTDFNNQYYGIFLDGGTGSISQSKFYPISNAIYNYSGAILDARNNWWGSVTGPTTPGNPAGTGAVIYGQILYFPWLSSDPLEGTITTYKPVIIIPGIMGSARKNGQLVIDPILHTYDDLIATLDENGYTPGVDLFTFPYEWRDSNVLSANLLKAKIDEVKNICNCSKVDLVAHSMGGLVAREYIQSGQYAHDVDQVIFLGTPHKGSPASYLRWEAGEFENDFFNALIKRFFQVEAFKNGYSSLFNYVKGRPISSVQELLPVSDYLKDKDTGIVRSYSTNYPRNIFLEALDNTAGISDLLNSGVRITNIVGNVGVASTIEKIRVSAGSNPLWVNGKPDGFDNQNSDQGLEYGPGDKTVTVAGATLDSSIPNLISQSEHTQLPSVEENNIFHIIANKDSNTNVHRSLIRKMLTIQLHSPIDMVIVAPDGKKLGKNFSNGQEYNEVPDAFYSGYNNNDDEYITIPNPLDGEYKIQLQGTGSGPYTVDTSYISDTVSTTTEVMGVTIPGQINNLNIELDNNAPGDLSLDPDLVADINKSFDVGWIKDKKIRDQLLNKANAIIKFEKKIDTVPDGKNKQKKIERLNKKIDKKAASALVLDLKGYNKDKITMEGYNLLKGDLEWIINH